LPSNVVWGVKTINFIMIYLIDMCRECTEKVSQLTNIVSFILELHFIRLEAVTVSYCSFISL